MILIKECAQNMKIPELVLLSLLLICIELCNQSDNPIQWNMQQFCLEENQIRI